MGPNNGRRQDDTELIEFVKKMTEAITVISESTRGIKQVSEDLRNTMAAHDVSSASSFQKIDTKLDGLMTMFKYVIFPLVSGILALVGIKMIFKL